MPESELHPDIRLPGDPVPEVQGGVSGVVDEKRDWILARRRPEILAEWALDHPDEVDPNRAKYGDYHLPW